MKSLNQVKRFRGFTLIELMIVIAIVAILITLAVPVYRDFTIHAKITECVNGGASPKFRYLNIGRPWATGQVVRPLQG